MLFRGLPTPGVDETISSWLFRCSINKRSSFSRRLHLGDRPSRWWDKAELKYVDPDTDVLIAVERLEAAGFKIDIEALKAHFVMPSGTSVAWSFRRFYCPECLRADVASGKLPMWKKSWCHEEASICTVHGNFLNILDDPSRYSKAWDAFVADCNARLRRNTETDRIFSRLRLTTISMVASKMGQPRDPACNDLVTLFNKLYHVFLQEPCKGRHGGTARIHFNIERPGRFTESPTLERSFIMGPATADPSSRFGSIMLASALLGVISESRYAMLVGAHETVNYNSLIPRDLHQAAAFPHLDRRGYGELRGFLGVIPRTSYPLLDRHFQLQEHRYKAEGSFDGYPLGFDHGSV